MALTMPSRIEHKTFGNMPDGRAVVQYELRTGTAALRVINLGGIVTGLDVPDRHGRRADVVLGFGDLDGYLSDTVYHGAVCGRFCNRIAGGRFELDGRSHVLACNDGPNHLHGGRAGFNRALWDAEPFTHGDACGLLLRHVSPDGDEGYPGELQVEAVYTLTPPATWSVEFRATTSRATHVNLTQHAYFNLSGHGTGFYDDHMLQLRAGYFLPKNRGGIPAGSVHPVDGTALDFRVPRRMVAPGPHADFIYESGYDHSLVVEGPAGTLREAARVAHPPSGRTLTVHTTQPGIHFYGGYYNNTSPGEGKHGRRYGSLSGFALETQHYPDTPNQPGFPSTVLRPGEVFREKTDYVFGVEEGLP